MKRILVITIIAIISVANCFAQDSKLYKKYGEAKGVTSVYMPLGWLAQTGMLNQLTSEIDDVDLAPIVNNLTLMVILTSEDNNGIKSLKEERTAITNDNKYSLLFQVKDDEDFVSGYFKSKDGESVEEFLLFAIEEDEVSVIQLFGNMTMSDLKKVAQSVNN